jgi:hypothetical protein
MSVRVLTIGILSALLVAWLVPGWYQKRGVLHDNDTASRSTDQHTQENNPAATAEEESPEDHTDGQHGLTGQIADPGQDAEAAAVIAPIPMLDLGRIAADSGSDEFTIELLNRSDSPVKIVRTETSCGCTRIGDVSRNPIPPGETAELKGKVQLHGAGLQRASIKIFAEGQSHVPTVDLMWEAVVGVSLSATNVFVEKIPVGRMAERSIVVTATEGESIAEMIENIEVNPGEFISHTLATEGRNATISLSIRGAEIANRYQGALAISLVNRAQPIRIPIEWSVEEPVWLEPAAVFRGTLTTGTTINCSFVVRGVAKVITPSDDETSRFNVTTSLREIANGFICEVSCRVPDSPGVFNITIPLTLADAEGVQHQRSFRISGLAKTQ